MARTSRGFWSLLIFCALAALGCQTAAEDPGTDSNTNWLDSCQSNEQCDGPYSCLCGVCTLACNDVGDCDDTPEASECRLSAEENGCPTAVCLPVNDVEPVGGDTVVSDDDTSAADDDTVLTDDATAADDVLTDDATAADDDVLAADDATAPDDDAEASDDDALVDDEVSPVETMPTSSVPVSTSPVPTNCPPCAAPPSPLCVGQGSCGCGPYVCPEEGSAGAGPSMGGAGSTDGGCETPPPEGSCQVTADCRDDQVCLNGPITECNATTPESLGTCSVGTCGDLGAPCVDGEVCVMIEISAFEVYRSWECVPNPCLGEPLSCTCADSLCEGSSVCYFVGPVDGRDYTADVSCFSISDCAAPDTPIATPSGNRPISSLVKGDLVYTLDDFGVRVVPLLEVRSKPAFDHSVLRIRFDDGAEWKISADHPTADGRLLLDLEPGEHIHEGTIVSIEQIPYEFGRTHDILPASPSGVYFADGVPVGSTLLRH